MPPRKKCRPSDFDALVERINLAAHIAGVKPETVCFKLFRDRNLLRSLGRARSRMIMRQARVEAFIASHGGIPEKGKADAE